MKGNDTDSAIGSDSVPVLFDSDTGTVDSQSEAMDTSTMTGDADTGTVDTETGSTETTDTETPDTETGDTETADSETETDTGMLTCIEEYNWQCTCVGDCMDGFGYTMFYHDGDDIGENNWVDPSAELRLAGIAWAYCSICGVCESWYKVKDEKGEWVEVSVDEFCHAIVNAQNACDNCIRTISGGGG